MEDLIRVLEKTVSNLQSDQNEAVRYIQDYIQRDFTGFLKALSDVLFDQQNPPVVRAAAGLQLKNQLTARDEALRHQQQERWRALPDETRQYIKERVFRTLGTEIFRPSSAPQCVAYIAIVELPEQRWPGLIQALTVNVSNPNSTPQLRLASLEAIGYICQDINQSCLQPCDSESILTAIVMHGLKETEIDDARSAATNSNDIRLAATTALLTFCDSKVQSISKTHPSISFDKLGEYLNIEPQYAERIVAQMIREEKIHGSLDQIDKVVHFESKNALQMFDEEILKLCSEVNDIIEKIRNNVPESWWAANAHQT